jgi:tRNA-Thr(GGU) m(6)t(6)A37 methyltransferase TsaA
MDREMDGVIMNPIGVIRTPFETLEGMPIQPAGAEQFNGQVVLDPKYEGGLDDIEGFSHLYLIYLFHQSQGFQLKVKPFLDDRKRGLFSTRAPRRPNPIGLSIVTLLGREKNILHVRHVDMLDGTPLLDIKPYVPAFDAPQAKSIGWLEGKVERSRWLRSDERFKK